MRTRDFQLFFVVLGLVISAFALSRPLGAWSAALSLVGLAGTLTIFSAWLHVRRSRSRSLLLIGAAVLLAATLWLEYALASVESPLRWVLSFAVAWMIAPLGAFALNLLAARLSNRGER